MTMEPLRSVPAGVNITLEPFDDYNRLIHQLQDAYAQHLSRNLVGALFQGNGGNRIGSTIDSRRGRQSRTNPVAVPAFPGVTNQDMTYNFARVGGISVVNYPGNGWLYAHSVDPGAVYPAVAGDIRELVQPAFYMENVVMPARANIVAGGVGAYQVATAPGPGGGWSNRGLWFSDTNYITQTTGAQPTDYFLYLNMGNTPAPNGFVPLRGDSSGNEFDIREHVDSRDSTLIQQVLLPLLINNQPTYTIQNGAGGSAGFWTDTRLVGVSNTTNTGTGPGTRPRGFGNTYTSTSTPSGGAVNIGMTSLERA